MCNLYTQSKSVDEVARIFRDLQMPLSFPKARPTSRRGTSPSPIRARSSALREARATSWSSAAGAGPRRTASRSIISALRAASSARGAMPDRRRRLLRIHQARRPPGQAQGSLAVHPARWRDVWESPALARSDPQVGEAFTMLTTEPGPDVAPYHNRQIAVLHRRSVERLARSGGAGTRSVSPLPAGSLTVTASPR